MAPIDIIDLSNTAKAYYAPATVTQTNTRLIHVSGQVGILKDGHFPADYESQIHLALLNLRKILITTGASVKDIAKLTMYIVNYDPARRKHAKPIEKFLQGHRPAMTLVPVSQLAAPGWLFEIDAVVSLPLSPEHNVQLSSISWLNEQKEEVDVVIVGAGLAGLAAAESILKAGLTCVVLEARDRVGGKTWSTVLSSGVGMIDLGAAWINNTNQTQVAAIARRVGAELIEQNTNGNCVVQDVDGTCSSFPYGELPRFDSATVSDISRIRDMCEADCQEVSTWKPNDKNLDSLTFEGYLLSRGASQASLNTATVWTRAMLGQEPRDISALFFLNYCKSGGGLLNMRNDRKDGAQYLRIRKGMQSLSLGLAASMKEGTVRLESPVVAISQHKENGKVEVVTKSKTFTARKVISTVPSPVLNNISFSPALPPAKQLWAQSTTYGYYTKAMMVFRSPFWVEKGFCGLTQSFTGPAAVIRDTCIPADDRHILTCFMAGDPGREWSKLDTPAREQKLLKQIGELFGEKSRSQREFVEMVTYEWVGDEFAGWGCPCTSVTPGVLDTVGEAIRLPWGNIHFAGTETAGEWKGYMEGAVRSGERAAAEVIGDFSSSVSAKL